MYWLGILPRLLLRRLRVSWGLMALMAFGVLAAMVLVVMAALYSRALAEAGLRHALSSQHPSTLHTRVIVQERPLGPQDYRRLQSTIEADIDQWLGWMKQDMHRYGRTQAMDVALEAGQPPFNSAMVAMPFFRTGLQGHSRLLEGRWPQSSPSRGPKGELVLEAAMGPATSRAMQWPLGTTIYLLPFSDPNEYIAVSLVGLVEPQDPDEIFWLGDVSYFSPVEEANRLLGPLYLSEEAFFQGLGAAYPSLVGNYWWMVYLDTDSLTARDAAQARSSINGLEVQVNKQYPRSLVLSGLDTTIQEYQRGLTLARVPLFLFTFLVVGVLLYFMAMTVDMMVRLRADEVVLIRSRGAGILQAGAIVTLAEGVAVVLAALAVGPLLALVLARRLFAASLNPLGIEKGAIPIELSPYIYLLAAGIGVLGLAVFLLASVGTARLNLTDFLRERARPPSLPLMQRYYVDALVLAVAGLLWWQARGRGGFVASGLFGGLEVDPSLMLAPVVILLAAGLILLRLLPFVLRGLAGLLDPLGPPWMGFALKRMARDPLAHGSLTIIIMAAAALGVFSAAFQPTLARSHEEQALYSAGADLRVTGNVDQSLAQQLKQELEPLPEVEAVAPVHRGTVQLPLGFVNDRMRVLAVTPEAMAQAAWFRKDFATKPVGRLLQELQPPVSGGDGISLPADITALGAWVKLSDFRAYFPVDPYLSARLQDSTGRYINVIVGQITKREAWEYLETSLADQVASTTPPFRLVALYLSGSLLGSTSGILDLSEVMVRTASSPDPVAVKAVATPGLWVPLPSVSYGQDKVEVSQEAAREGGTGVRFTWAREASTDIRGIFVPNGPVPVPVIGGPSLVPGQQFSIKRGQSLVPVTVVDVVNYFPTLNPREEQFMLIDLTTFSAFLERLPGFDRVAPNEVWIKTAGGSARNEAVAQVRALLPSFASLVDSQEAVEVADRNPMRGGGWGALTTIGLSVLSGVVLLGVALYGLVSLRRARVDLTVARAMGFSGTQVLLSIVTERTVVLLLGLLLGSGVGVFLGRWSLGYLDLTPTGARVLPPMVLTFDGKFLSVVFLGVLGASLVATAFTLLRASRLNPAEVLRQEE